MPELPEVETSRRGIIPHFLEQTLLYVVVRNGRLRWPVSAEISALSDCQLLAVRRRAKYLLLQLPHGWIIVHLGMSGSLRVLPQELPAAKHDHIDVVFSNGKVLRYTDPRRFGCWLWTDDPDHHPLLVHLGPEPLSDAFNADYLLNKSSRKRCAIKPWLMDNRLVVGVGNIYASESLFDARLHPDKPAASLRPGEAQRLVQAIKAVLQRAIDQGGTTLRDFTQTDGKPGYFVQELQVYGRAGEACRQCGGMILSGKHGQRATYWCPGCQPR